MAIHSVPHVSAPQVQHPAPPPKPQNNNKSNQVQDNSAKPNGGNTGNKVNKTA